jgi:gas vesicle protein
VLGDPRTVRRHDIVRFQSTEAVTVASNKRLQDREALADAPLSLLDRLDRTPLWRHGEEDPVVVRPAIAYPHKREAREALQRKHRALTQQARVENRREQDRPGDWRSILHNLMRWTPTYSTVQHGIKIIIPEHSAELLWSDYENNVWNIKSRTGCDMTLYRPTDFAAETENGVEGKVKGDGESHSEGTKPDPYIVLTGQPTAVSAAVYDILKITKGVTIIGLEGGTPTVLHDGGEARPPVAPLDASATSVPSAVTQTPIPHYPRSAPCRPYTLNMRADQIPRPAEWTIEAFQHYIAALTMGRMNESLAAKLYPGADTHQRIVVKQLHDVFNDPAASAAVSNPAFKLALQYLVRAGETFVGDARALFGSVGTLGLRMDTEVYNLMAETAVMSKNLLAFEGIIRRMAACGHAPNLRTWLLFLRLVEAEDVRRYILHAMGTKNFFSNPTAVASVSVEMADHDVHRAIQLEQDFDAFIAGLRALYGPEWRLHTRAANRYLDVFGRYSRFDESRKLLEFMFASEHCTPNVISLNTVLTHCKLQNKVDLAVCFIRMFDQQGLNVADKITFHLLFEVARKTRKTYLLGAVWRYAHVLGMTKHSMRDRGIRLLAGGEQEVKHMTYWIRGLWDGPDGCKTPKQELLETLLLCDWRNPPRSLEHASGQSAEHSPEHKYYLFSNFMTKLAQKHVPAVPLGDFLQAALDHDRKLRRLLLDGERVPEAMVLHTVELPLARVTDRKYQTNRVLRWLAKRQGKKEDVAAPQETVSGEVAELKLRKVAREEGREVTRHISQVEREDKVLAGMMGQEVAEPVQEVAKPVQEVAQPVQEVSQPAQDVTQPVQEVAAEPVQAVAELVHEVAEPVQEVAKQVQEEMTMDIETEAPLHAIPAETLDGVPNEMAGQEVAEPMQAEEALDNLDAVWATAETQPTTLAKTERKDGVLEEGMVSQEVDEPIQEEVATNNQAKEIPDAALATEEDAVSHEAMSHEAAESLQAEEAADVSDVAGLIDETPSAQPELLTMGQAETGNVELEGILNREAAEPPQEDEAMGSLHDGGETEELSHAIQSELMTMEKADTEGSVLEEVMSWEAAEPIQEEEEGMRPLGADGEIETPNTVQPEPVTVDQANEDDADSLKPDVQAQTIGTAASEEVGDLVQKVAQVQGAQPQSFEENNTQSPTRRSRGTARRIDGGQPSWPDKPVDASRSAQVQAAKTRARKWYRARKKWQQARKLYLERAIKVLLDGAARQKGKNGPSPPDKRVIPAFMVRCLYWELRRGYSETETVQPKLGKTPSRAKESRPNPLPGKAPPETRENRHLYSDSRRQGLPRGYRKIKTLHPKLGKAPPQTKESGPSLPLGKAPSETRENRPRGLLGKASPQKGENRPSRVLGKARPRKDENTSSQLDLADPNLREAPRQTKESRPSRLDPPAPKPAALEASPSTTAEESRDDEEDPEAMERAHSVLRYLLNAAEKFGTAKPQQAQTGMLGKPGAGMGMGVQHPALPADRWGYAADGRKETMASGYLMGPSRDFEGGRMQTPTGPGGR